jgi:D-amino-acid oxidase
MRIEPSIYLDALLRDFLLFGGRIVIRRFDAPRDLMALSEPVIVNCTGLGSRALFNDQELMPVKGQLSVLIPQSEVDYRISGGGVSTMPRSDGIALGGTTERDVWTLEPNEEARQRIVGSAVKLFAGMSVAAAGARLTRSAPPATAPRVESFFAEES